MAFGFIKKVFSFGRKEAVEQPAEDEVLPPLNFDALEALKPAEEIPVAAEAPAVADAPAAPVEEPKPEPAPVIPPAPPVVPEPKPAEQPAPVEPTPQPVPQEEPKPEPVPDVPAPEPEQPAERPTPAPSPVEPEPAPAEVPVPATEPSTPELPEEIPAQPVPAAPEPAMRAPETEPVVEEPVVEALQAAEPVAEARPVDPVIEEPAPAEVAEPVATAVEAEQPVAALREIVSEPAAVVPAPVEPVQPAPAPEPKPSAGKVTVQKKVEQKAEVVEVAAPAPRQSWFQRLRQGLSRSSKELSGNIAGIFTKRKLDEDTLQDLEDVLIRADLGVETALRVTDALAASRYGKDVSDHEVRSIMAVEVEKVLKPVALPLELDLSHKPHVILVVGVNGTGKTTTIGKLAAKLTEGGLSVMLAAGDTFRAAAIEQLKIWGERTNSPVIATKLGADAAGLAYDAFEKAKEAGSDVLIIDTAGRLQNKTELMAELEKIVRVLGKLDPEAPHTVLQTVDATTGQNALNQVEIFRNIAGVNGLVMTKLDGTARGGILVAIAAKHKLPVYFIGVGEQVDDLEPFSASDFAKAIAGVA
ncbi:fused signal recognition particle receptor [Aminobacter lissarensis]|uniref:Signal recognition particle receptor FtsY n=1 Tax=Aminobacter carboxidus TaxID=376165 RepID=A0A8E1WBR4_9HYPH|nr:signal recognition particle-docking protein FtsY [Aminobacter lissarensis]MBB6465780.1 fused signal recognition particle receptor [Aminobacter lissarensis]